MNLYFLFIQFIDILAWILLIVSYYREDTNKILFLQILSTILFCLHYYLLGAYSGLFICLFEVIRDYAYYKTDLDKYIFIGSIPIYVLGGIYSYSALVDVFPIMASLIDGYTLTKSKNIVVIGAIISYTLWVIYDISVMSYSGAVTDGLVVLSNLFVLFFGNSVLEKYNDIIKKNKYFFRKKL